MKHVEVTGKPITVKHQDWVAPKLTRRPITPEILAKLGLSPNTREAKKH